MSFQLQNSEVLARLKPFGISFEKSLNDLIKGIRAHSKESSDSLASFLDVAIQECKNELSTTDLETKAMAILKLAYLEMYGFDMSWCNFQILEVMASNKFQQKRIGYLAAIQSFKNEQDLLLLATNQFKKDLNSHNHVEIGLALSGIATIVTPNLAKDINDDVLMKLSHSKPYIRKKAILAMYKIFLQYPESLRLNFDRVIEKLDDPDIAVVSATVNVICEISKKNPNIFISYLPKFFNILEETRNNWLIIRILKLFQSLSKVEPRMKKKILPTIMELMLRTQASSLIYECINCIVNGQMLNNESSKDEGTAKVCINQLMNFFKTKDSNLKFVGLLALINILKIFPVFMHKEEGVSAVIMDCLTDSDMIIKRKALEICHYLVTEDNITELVKLLLLQLVPSETNVVSEVLKQEISLKILTIATQDNYTNIPNFRWYVAVLKDVINLTLLPLPSSANEVTVSPEVATTIANELGNEFKNLATKVPSVRPILLTKVVFPLVQDSRIIDICPILLRDFYWIMGEYIDELKNGESDDDDDDDEAGSGQQADGVASISTKIEIFNSLVNFKIDKALGLTTSLHFPISAKLVSLGHPEVLAVLIQALIKLFSSIVSDFVKNYTIQNDLPIEKYDQLCYYLYKLIGFLGVWETHPNYEVQERALSWLEFLRLTLEAMTGNDLTVIKRLEAEDLEYYRGLKEKNEPKVDESSEDESEEDSEVDESEEESAEEYDNLESSDDEEVVQAPHIVPMPEFESNPFAAEDVPIEDTVAEGSEPVFDNDTGATSKRLPVLLTHILPSFFKSYQLNPVARNAQRNIPIPDDLDLDTEINPPPFQLDNDDDVTTNDTYELFLSDVEEDAYQEPLIQLTSEDVSERKKERLERLKDDPYYLGSDNTDEKRKKKSKESTNTPESQTEITSISTDDVKSSGKKKAKKPAKLKKEKVLILNEETVGTSAPGSDLIDLEGPKERTRSMKKKKNVIKIDSSNLDNFDLTSSEVAELNSKNDHEYEIDLDALRQSLAKSSIDEKDEKKKKKKKSTTKKSKSKKEVTESAKASEGENQHGSEQQVSEQSPTPIITVKPKKKTKKSKAIILD
ncbi:apl5 [[Candida] subhashii]|uniref:AP-3 complex subunit delta n=1 Tax=[Candida] subhashii TaxID=561895 RepID=A0A8J5Q9Y0_9ASCO|nr:apl5 [[Candida] subhashii]KAG7663224.1 apl5 [[Candida] subhashii]